jgi:two-component system, chemotaxis family, sensor kinase CheA
VDQLEAIKATFFQECEEQLAELESGLLALKDGSGDAETVNAVFRAVHSIKGGAGAFGLENLVKFAHVFETTMDEVRSGRLEPRPDLLDLMLRAFDMLSDHVRASRNEGTVDEAASQTIAEELAMQCQGGDADDGLPEPEIDFTPIQIEIVDFGAAPAESAASSWTVRFRPKPELYANANEPLLLLRELQRLGDISVQIDAEGLPLLQDLDPEGAYLAWTVTLITTQDERDIREVFDFVDGNCDIEIARVAADAAPSEGEVAMIELPAVTTPPLAPEIVEPVAEAAPAEPVAADTAAAKPEKAADKTAAVAAPSPTIRVDLDRVERLIDLVGELVINQAMLSQRVTESGLARASSVSIGLEELEGLTREIQECVMSIRAQPVKSVFQRMTRLVREVASATGKQVKLVMEGEGTEVDKTVIERISDPITHMLRNAIDHGLEKPVDRAAAGKSPEGIVKLSAMHRSGRIVIEVSDDGAGIDRKRVRAIAAKKGLIAPDANLTDDEIDNLIFMPGFSTAETVSDISGRGVGMDVVRRSIQALGGRISITSRPGLGSTFSLSLPLTLAVLDGMVVSAAGQTLVAPLNAVVETLQPKASELRTLVGSAPLILIRDMYVPLIDIGWRLGYRDEPIDPSAGVALLLENEGGGRVAFLVDAIQGQRQVVIKSLEANYRKVDGIAAATILGDGRVALILDIDALMSSQRMDVFKNELHEAVG